MVGMLEPATGITEGSDPAQRTLVAHPVLAGLTLRGRELLLARARPFEAPPSLFRQEGDVCAGVTLLTAGRVRVVKRRPSGREITLYAFGAGELCVLEVLAVLTGAPYRAEAIIEERAAGVSVPADAVRAVVDIDPGLRSVLFSSLEQRLAMALDLVGDIALGTLEARLARLILGRARGIRAPEVREPDAARLEVLATHGSLALELACAREAVSRILGSWERAGLVGLGRGRIAVLDATTLAIVAGLEEADRAGA